MTDMQHDTRNATLPDGSMFAFWEQPFTPQRTLVVDQNHESASDTGDGSADQPFATIQAAADVAQPGDRVLVHEGVYRECVRPAHGGTDAAHMISYEAAPGERVVITGGELITGRWEPSHSWRRRSAEHEEVDIRQIRLPREWFIGGNPFATPNRAVSNLIGGFSEQKSDRYDILCQRCGMLYQQGRRMTQVTDFTKLLDAPGAFYPDATGLILHVRPFDDVDPNDVSFEATARSQCFAPDRENLGYIRVKGFQMCMAGNLFPFMPQQGALSAHRGHHWIIEDCHVHDCNSVGIEIGRRDPRMTFPDERGHMVVRRCTVRECGISGIVGLGALRYLVEDNLVEDCCWHDIEHMWESAGIKTHRNVDTLVRRNVVRRIKHGCGIWLDFDNNNSRCTQNVVLETHSLFGGIFVEATHFPMRVDHNIIAAMHTVTGLDGSEGAGGHGVYAHDTDFLEVDHCLMLNCAGAAVHLPKGQPDRMVQGRGSISRDHHIHGNLIVDCQRHVELKDEHNQCDGNAYAGDHANGPFRLLGAEEWHDLKSWRDFCGFEEQGTVMEAAVSIDIEALEVKLTAEALPQAEGAAGDVDVSGTPRESSANVGPIHVEGKAFAGSIDPRMSESA